MNQKNYTPPTHELWQGRTDSLPNERFFQVVQCIDLHHEFAFDPSQKNYALLGFCSDEGIRRNQGRLGASTGPAAIRTALAKLPMHHLANAQLYDVGDIGCPDADLENAQQQLAAIINRLLQQKITPIILGGGHETAWGHYQGIASAKQHANLGIINFDAHFDLRQTLPNDHGTSGSSFWQIAQARTQEKLSFDYLCIGIQKLGNTRSLFETAQHYKTTTIYADDIHLMPIQQHYPIIDQFIQQHQQIYLSLCLDVIATGFAPGVSAPQPTGIYPWHVIPFLRQIAESGKVISFDIVELSPPFDRDHMTARLAAALIAEFISHSNNGNRH